MSDWENHLQNLRDEQDRRDFENKSLGKNLGARRRSDFDNPVFWGMIGAILGGILGRGLIGALVGGAFFGGGLYLVKRALDFESNSSRIKVLRWGLLGALVGVVVASVIGGVSLFLSLALGSVLGGFIGKSRLAR